MDLTREAVEGGGKIARSTFERVILPRLGASRPEVLVGPRHGGDCGIVELGNGTAMAITCDPFFVMPELGWERAGWFAVHIVASDLATSGFAPAYLTVDLNLPPDTPDADLERLWEAVSGACAEIGMSVVTGHTGRYEGCAFPTIGGATAAGIGPSDAYVTPAMAREGDVLIVTKGAAIETTGMFGATFPERLALEIGPDLAREAAALFGQMSVVHDARAAIETGVREEGVTAMHDATERGIWGAVTELAEAAGAGLVIHADAIPIPDAAGALCRLVDIDPYSASSEGTLVLTCRPRRAGDAIQRLEAAGIRAARIGELLPLSAGMQVVEAGSARTLVPPREDPFWPAYRRALDLWGA